MKYSELKERIKLLHKFNYEKIPGVEYYKKYFSSGNHYVLQMIDLHQILSFKRNFEKLLDKYEEKNVKKLESYIQGVRKEG